MAFVPKDWKNASEGALTPVSAEALEDLETRLAAYVDSQVSGAGGGGPLDPTLDEDITGDWTFENGIFVPAPASAAAAAPKSYVDAAVGANVTRRLAYARGTAQYTGPNDNVFHDVVGTAADMAITFSVDAPLATFPILLRYYCPLAWLTNALATMTVDIYDSDAAAEVGGGAFTSSTANAFAPFVVERIFEPGELSVATHNFKIRCRRSSGAGTPQLGAFATQPMYFGAFRL